MKAQRGGFFLGTIVGLLIGLALALAVAIYITKVPLPFIDKVPLRTPAQDAAEVENNRNWDPNSPLYGKNPAKPNVTQPVVQEPVPVSPDGVAPPAQGDVVTTDPANPNPVSARDPAAILSGEGLSTNTEAEPLMFYVQAGAYVNPAEAEQQRARLAMLNLDPRVVEREVGGRNMYRVRIGPFANRELADEVRARLSAEGVETALVRMQK